MLGESGEHPEMNAQLACSSMGVLRREVTVFDYLALIVILVSAVAGCSQSGNSSQVTEPSGPLLSIDPTSVGSINGTVTIEGNSLVMDAITTTCNKTNASGTVPEAPVDRHTAELARTVIYLKAGLAKYRYDAPKEHVVLDQRGCVYDPHVIALRTNQPLEIRNSDQVAHNVHVLAKVNRPWDHSERAGAPPIIESFAKPELAVHVICKIHAGMSAFLFIFDNPYYAIPSSAGAFELKNVPPGTYTVEAWQEHLGILDQTVTISPNQSKAVSFIFKAANSQGN